MRLWPVPAGVAHAHVDKEELLKQVWPDTFSEEAALAKTVSILRKPLGKVKGGRQYIGPGDSNRSA